MMLEPYNVCLTDRRLNQLSLCDSPPSDVKVKSFYNPLRPGTVIVLVSTGIDFVNTPRLYSLVTEPRAKRDCQFALRFVPEGAQSAWTLQETRRYSTSHARDEAGTSERLISLPVFFIRTYCPFLTVQ